MHLTIHTCICIALPDFCMMQVSSSCLLKRETLLHSCAPHKHLHKSKETKNFRSDPSEHWFFMHSTAVCSIGQLGWAGSSCSIKDYDSLYGVEVKVCFEVQKQPKLVIHRNSTYKHKTDAQTRNGNTWVRFPLIRNDVTAICSHLLQMWRLIKHWEVISAYNPDLAPYNVLKCVCLHMWICACVRMRRFRALLR